MSNMYISVASLSLSRTTGPSLPDHGALVTEASLTVEGADSNFADVLCGARTQLHALVLQVKRTLIHPDTHTYMHRLGCMLACSSAIVECRTCSTRDLFQLYCEIDFHGISIIPSWPLL